MPIRLQHAKAWIASGCVVLLQAASLQEIIAVHTHVENAEQRDDEHDRGKEHQAKRERDQLWTTVNRLINIAIAIETNADCLKRATEYQTKFDLSPQDSIVYAAVIFDMQRRRREEPKCFLNSNYKDFEIPDILDELNSYYCYYERSFGKGLNYIQQCLKNSV